MMRQSTDVEEWYKNINKNYEILKESMQGDREDWTSIKYFSKLLYCGSSIAYAINVTLPVFAKTSNIENIEPSLLKAYCDLFEDIALTINGEFCRISEYLKENAPDEPEIGSMEFVS